MSDKEGPKLAERPEKEGRKIAEPPKAMQKDTTTGEGANIKKLYPVSDKDIKALKDKAENDSNSYSKINKSIIDRFKKLKGDK